MKQEIENIIKKNLPEKEIAQFGRETSWEMEHANGFNQALSQINTSLIADEVLKVVRQIIEDKIKFQKKVLPSSYETGYTHALEDLLSTLSPIKENENNMIEEIPQFKGTNEALNNLSIKEK